MEKGPYLFELEMSEALLMESSSGRTPLAFGTDMLQIKGDKSGSGIDSCLFPLAACFLPSMAELPNQMLDFSDFHVRYRSIYKHIELS